MAKKIEVCFLCNHSVGDLGVRLEHVAVTTQLGLLQQKALKSTICYECFREKYKFLRINLEQQLIALKRSLEPDV